MVDETIRAAVNDIRGLIQNGVTDGDLAALDDLVVDILYGTGHFDDRYDLPTFNPLVPGVNYGVSAQPPMAWFRWRPGRPVEVTPHGDNLR